MTAITVKTGGKLYIAGEYAVLVPGQTAIIKNIPIYMTAEIKPAKAIELFSDMFTYGVGMSPDINYQLIQESIRTFATFLDKEVSELAPFSLLITGKMERDGKKFGIGSSGSVTVLVIKALSAFYGISLTKDQLFKLSAYTLLKLGDNGSMGDIACIAYDDLVAYQSFDRQAISDLLSKKSLVAILEMDWGYQIDVLIPSLKTDFLVGWTRQPALSSQMVREINSRLSKDFLMATEKEVALVKSALQSGDKLVFASALQKVSDLLVSLSPTIYTDKLKLLKEASSDLDVVAKSSGAGGGDCGIALSFNPDDTVTLKERWQKAGIEILYQESWS